MSITASEMTPADIAAVTNNNGGNGGFGGFGGDSGAWWLLVLLFAMNGGWFGGNRGYGGQGAGSAGGDALYPWLNQAQNNWEGISQIQQSLCNGFAGVNQTVQNGFAQAEIAANSRQMADMNQNFALQSQLAQCCCENRLATANLNSTIISENCADREALNSIGRDIIAAQTAGTQRILDKLCDQELFAERRENDNLRQQLNMANLAASQIAQTAQIREGQNITMTNLVNELRSCPIPAQPVYGSQPIFTCPNNNNGCGCGCNNGFAN